VVKILAIYNGGGVEGLSMASIYADVPSYLLAVLYHALQGNPFSAWGELAFLLLQSVIILGQCWYYRKASFTEVFVAMSVAACMIGGSSSLPLEKRSLLLVATLPFNFAARGGQVWANFRQGHTGRLSGISTALNFLGAAARVFTTAIEVKGDLWALTVVAIGATWNGILLSQILVYRKATREALEQGEKDKQKLKTS